MIAFWIVAALGSAGAAVLMLRGAARAAAQAVGADPTLAVHARQLAEIDDLAGRGLLAEPERKAARAEAGRRLLAAADRGQAPQTELKAARPLALAAAASAPLLAVGIYLYVGAPSAPDQPFAQRVAQWRAGDPSLLGPQQMAAVLRAVVRERPSDPEPLRNLALAEIASDRPTLAAQAMRQAVALAPQRADLWASLGEAFVFEGDGAVGPDARRAFTQALKRDPKWPSARYHLARADIEDGKAAQGLAGWRALLADLPPGDARRAPLAAEIAAVEATGTLPTAKDEMAGRIQAMVGGLAARLEAEPMDPEGWARLVRAYVVLGEEAKRDAALARARALFKDQPKVLAALEDAAK